MRSPGIVAFGRVAALVATLVAGAAWAGDQETWRDLETGLKAARRSGRPVLVVTLWPPRV